MLASRPSARWWHDPDDTPGPSLFTPRQVKQLRRNAESRRREVRPYHWPVVRLLGTACEMLVTEMLHDYTEDALAGLLCDFLQDRIIVSKFRLSDSANRNVFMDRSFMAKYPISHYATIALP